MSQLQKNSIRKKRRKDRRSKRRAIRAFLEYGPFLHPSLMEANRREQSQSPAESDRVCPGGTIEKMGDTGREINKADNSERNESDDELEVVYVHKAGDRPSTLAPATPRNDTNDHADEKSCQIGPKSQVDDFCEGEVAVVGMTNKNDPLVALPHFRFSCGQYKFRYAKQYMKKKYCPKCFCFICDDLVSDCPSWTKGPKHFKASDKNAQSKRLRAASLSLRRELQAKIISD